VRVVAAIAAGLLAIGWDTFYLTVLWSEGEHDLAEPGVIFVAISVGAAAVFLAASWAIPSPTVRTVGLVAAAVTLAGYAVLAALSIGIFLVPAVLLAFYSASRTGDAARTAQWAGVCAGLASPVIFLVALAPG